MKRRHLHVLLVVVVAFGVSYGGGVLTANARVSTPQGVQTAPCVGVSAKYATTCASDARACTVVPTSEKSVCTADVAKAFAPFRTNSIPKGSTGGTSSGETSSATSGQLTSPNGLYSITVTNSGITLSGPVASIKLDGTGVAITGVGGTITVDGMVELDGCGEPVAIKGDTIEGGGGGGVGVSGVISQGSARVCAD